MWKTKRRTRLTLSSDTLRRLETSQLQQVNGAAIYSPEPKCSALTAVQSCMGSCLDCTMTCEIDCVSDL